MLRLGLELYTACETVRRYLVVIVVVIKSQSQGRDRGERNTYATLVVYRSPQPCPRQAKWWGSVAAAAAAAAASSTVTDHAGKQV